MEEDLRRLIIEGTDEEIQRRDALMSVLSKTYAIQTDRKERELELARYHAERAGTTKPNGQKYEDWKKDKNKGE